MRVGIIGLGNMGTGMAISLLKVGHDVTVYNRTRAKADALAARGATVAAGIVDACRGDAVITMLANDDAVERVMYGRGGVFASLAQGAIHISSSTISVALSERLAADHVSAGQRFVSAPVFGRPDVAAAGELFVVAAGSHEALESAAPLFDAIGKRTFVVSETPKAANLVKLSGNFLLASVIELLGEAMALVAKGGIDRKQYLDILTSTLFGAPAYRTLWRADCRREVRAGRLRGPSRLQGYRPHPRRRRRIAGAVAAREPPARPVPDLIGPGRREARLVGDRRACGQGRRRGERMRARTRSGPHPCRSSGM